MKLKIPMRLCVFVLAAMAASSCSDSKSDNPVTPATEDKKVSFAGDITPIFQANGCVNCHGDRGGLSLATVESILKGGDHGPAVIPGNAASSTMLKKISATPPFGARMPFNGTPVKDKDVELLTTWVNQGAKNN
jgi:hypothetical protein